MESTKKKDRPVWQTIPGFRTRTPWKMALATLVYVGEVLTFLAAIHFARNSSEVMMNLGIYFFHNSVTATILLFVFRDRRWKLGIVAAVIALCFLVAGGVTDPAFDSHWHLSVKP